MVLTFEHIPLNDGIVSLLLVLLESPSDGQRKDLGPPPLIG